MAILTTAEVSAMLACAGSLRDRAFLACLYETGVRKSELAALRLKHVQPTNDHFTLWFGKVKVTGEEHEGFIIEAGAILRAWLEAHPWGEDPEAFPFPTASGGPINAVRIWDFIKKTAKRAGITKRVYPQLFRHSRATHPLQLGVPEAQVKALLGWRQGSPMLARYSHLTSRTAKAAYLKALGREPEKVVVPEGVNFDGATMGAVRPMFLRPKAPQVKTPAGIDSEGRIFDSKLLMKEAVAEALASPATTSPTRTTSLGTLISGNWWVTSLCRRLISLPSSARTIMPSYLTSAMAFLGCFPFSHSLHS